MAGIEQWQTLIAKLERLGISEDSIWFKQAKFKVKILSFLKFDELEKAKAISDFNLIYERLFSDVTLQNVPLDPHSAYPFAIPRI